MLTDAASPEKAAWYRVGADPANSRRSCGSVSANRLAAVTQFSARLMLSPDGSTLGLFRCVHLDCVLRAVRVDDGSLVGETAIQRGFREPFGISDAVAALGPIVPDGPERFGELIDLSSGAGVAVPLEAWPQQS